MLADYVSIGPGAILAGAVRVGTGALIGAGAVIQPGVRIGAGALIAAGAVVRKHVADDATVAGNPATPRRHDAQRALARLGGEE
jgi:acetyltransferase-like isoleucine patch superfamily enzyme